MATQYPRLKIPLPEGKKIYFASDFHLGAPDDINSRKREQLLIEWMKQIKDDATAVFLVGDLFDFWFEYKKVVPKGFTRFLAAVAGLRETGISVHVFTGNHDIWMFGYLEDELGVKVHKQPILLEAGTELLFVGHGDGLGPDDTKFKLMKKVFTYSLFQWLFSWLHPDIGIAIAQKWSAHSRTDPATERFMGKDRERLYQYALMKSAQIPARYFIFGHRHLPIEIPIEDRGATYINLGDWLYNYTYLEFDGSSASLRRFEERPS